jgi:hypothetical protein
MQIHLVNPSDTAFGTAVITPRWLYVLAAATPSAFGDPLIWDETLDPLDPVKIRAGDVVGIPKIILQAGQGRNILICLRDTIAVRGGYYLLLFQVP